MRNKGNFDEVDYVYISHRSTGHALAKGVDMKKMAAENDFRATGLNGGYGGEMHLSDKSCGFIGADGMIGPAPPMAAASRRVIPGTPVRSTAEAPFRSKVWVRGAPRN